MGVWNHRSWCRITWKRKEKMTWLVVCTMRGREAAPPGAQCHAGTEVPGVQLAFLGEFECVELPGTARNCRDTLGVPAPGFALDLSEVF